MNDQELTEIRSRLERTTQGPWTSLIEGRDFESGSSFIMTGINKGQNIWDKSRGEDIYLTGATTDDQEFIAHARQDIPRMLDYISALKREIERIKNRT